MKSNDINFQELKIGSRESRLAVAQAKLVSDYIRKKEPDRQVKIITMKTTGDKILDRTLDKIGGKGLFVKELDIALREGRTDISVHSLKDIPMEVPTDLPLIGFSKREDPRDVLVLPKGVTKQNTKLPLGCSSQRRIIQLAELFPDIKIKSIRGNVLTRLEKLDRGEYGGLVLAAAGLKRLGLEARISRYFEIEEMIPAAGQGILALQARSGENYDFLDGFNQRDSGYAAICERAFVRRLNGGCSAPIAAHATVCGNKIALTGLYFEEESGRRLAGSMTGDVEKSEWMGITLAEKLKGSHP